MTAKRWGAPLAVAIVIALVAGIAVWLARGSSGSAQPTVLHLGSTGGPTTAMAAAIATEPEPSMSSEAGQEPYKLVGTLPDGQPDDQLLYRLPKATLDDAVTVARALHLDGTPSRIDGGWILRNGNDRLAVRDDGTWSYGLDCFTGPEAQEELTVECAYASAGSAVAPATTASPGTTRSTDAPPPPTPSVAPEPRPTTAHIDGLPVVNWTPWFVVKRDDGSIESGNGWVGTPQRGASYPIITAQRAFELLQQQPRPMMAMCMVRPDGKPGCAPIPPSEITGAELGLTLDYDGDKPVLVPAWLFAVKGQDMPIAQIAIEPQYLATPSPYPIPKGVPVEPPIPAEPPGATLPAPAPSESP